MTNPQFNNAHHSIDGKLYLIRRNFDTIEGLRRMNRSLLAEVRSLVKQHCLEGDYDAKLESLEGSL